MDPVADHRPDGDRRTRRLPHDHHHPAFDQRPVASSAPSQGLVTRTRNPEDERSVTVALTSEGDALRVHAPRIYGVITETFGFTPDRADAALDVLQSIVAHAAKTS